MTATLPTAETATQVTGEVAPVLIDGVEHLPVFVYGTLRAGQGNWAWALRGRTAKVTEATYTGGDMYDQGGFPYVIAGTGIVFGDLMYIDAEQFTDVMADLDTLEGYRPGGTRNLYDRLIVETQTIDGATHRAWMYQAAEIQRPRVTRLPAIVSGDWVRDGIRH